MLEARVITEILLLKCQRMDLELQVVQTYQQEEMKYVLDILHVDF
jgi:hypothetical protein